jgi:hypothetical protein
MRCRRPIADRPARVQLSALGYHVGIFEMTVEKSESHVPARTKLSAARLRYLAGAGDESISPSRHRPSASRRPRFPALQRAVRDIIPDQAL